MKPTLQIADDTLPNVYTCGDVANTGVRNPNSRSAYHQAKIVADNIALAVRGKKPRHIYTPHWADRVIKLTLGLVSTSSLVWRGNLLTASLSQDKSITHFEDDKTELLFPAEEKDLALMCAGSWAALGVKPFEDDFGPISMVFRYEDETKE